MTDVPSSSPSPVANNPFSDDRQLATIAYIAYLAAFALPPLGLVGVVLAYVARDTAPDWLKSHYTFQIYTFWLGLLYWVISLVLCVVLIGVPLLFATFAWYIVRCALGLSRLMRREPYPNPQTWVT